MIFFSQKGQAFEPFKLLIGAVMALAVLVIIIGAINYFEGLSVDVSRQRFSEGLQNAVRQPNGSPLLIENLKFQRDASFSSGGIGKLIGIPEDCVSFTDPGAKVFEVTDSKLITVHETVLTSVLVRCDIDKPPSCRVGCEITFGDNGSAVAGN